MSPQGFERPVLTADLQLVSDRQLRGKSAPGTEELQGQCLLPVLAANTITSNMHGRLQVVRLAGQYQDEVWLPERAHCYFCFRSPHLHFPQPSPPGRTGVPQKGRQGLRALSQSPLLVNGAWRMAAIACRL